MDMVEYLPQELACIMYECDKRCLVVAAPKTTPPPAAAAVIVAEAVCDDGTLLARHEGRYVDPETAEAHFPHRCFSCEACTRGGGGVCVRKKACVKTMDGVRCCKVKLERVSL